MMSNKFNRFGSIEDYRTKLKAVAKHDRNSENKIKTITLRGHVKVHGINSGVSLHKDGSITIQSRERIIEATDNDSYGIQRIRNIIGEDLIRENLEAYLETGADTVTMYGEFFGERIQNGVAVSSCKPSFMAFGIRGFKDGEMIFNDRTPKVATNHETRFYSKNDFENYVKSFDGFDVDAIKEYIEEVTEKVDARCPVGHALVENPEFPFGEGVVWDVIYDDGECHRMTFKSKGSSHKRAGKAPEAKVSGLSEEETKLVEEFIKRTVTTDRMEQGFEFLKASSIEIDMKAIGQYIAWVQNDIKKEHVDDANELLISNGVSFKHALKVITTSAREYYMSEFENK